MGGCSAYGCSNHSRNKVRLFRFPANPERRQVWVENSLRFDLAIPGSGGELCAIHFEETQFELHRLDGWKKLKPNAIPTLFPEPTETPKAKRATSRKRKRSPSAESEEAIPVKKSAGRKKSKSSKESSSKKKKVTRKSSSKSSTKIVIRRKRDHSETDGVKKDKQGTSDNSQNSQKENVSPRLRKSPKPRKLVTPPASDSSTEEDDNYVASSVEDESDKEDEAEQIEALKRENDTLKNEVAEFEKHNKAMARVILELEKHNKLMGMKLGELDKDNKVLTKKVSDLETLNEDLKSKLNCCLTEEQIARMDKMRALGTIERYIPALNK